MRVLVNPSAKPWKGRVTCRCESQLEYEISDVVRTVHDQRDGSAAVIRCPVCSAEIWINLSNIPSHLHHKLS